MIEGAPLNPSPDLRPGPHQYIASGHVIVRPLVPLASPLRGDPSPDCVFITLLPWFYGVATHIYL